MASPNFRSVRRGHLAPLLLLATLPWTAGCATQQTLQEYEDTIVRLREEKTQLQRENQTLRGDLSRYEAELAMARADLQSMNVQPASAPALSQFDNPEITWTNREGLLAINIPSSITFASGSADLSAGGKQALQNVANVLARDYATATYWIEGHTDTDQPSKGKYKSNRDLSVARANSVLEFLVNSAGIPDDKCVIAGHSQYRPLSPSASKSQNRRVEIVVHPAR